MHLGQTFVIRTINHSPTYMSFHTTVDGRAFPRPSCLKPGGSKSIQYRDSAGGTKPLLFSYVRHTGQCSMLSRTCPPTSYFCDIDDEAALQHSAMANHIGSIEIQVLRTRFLHKTAWREPKAVMASEVGVVHESAKKIGMHCVSYVYLHERGIISSAPTYRLGETKATPAPSLSATRYIDTKASPYITFHFRYRPRGTSSH